MLMTEIDSLERGVSPKVFNHTVLRIGPDDIEEVLVDAATELEV